jgi:ubiquinone/menaquinone biosynthesis C-methylase UbiE
VTVSDATAANATFASYAFGHSDDETRRLQTQAQLFGSSTRRLLVEAGISPGMRVLDVGSGAGDVALLVAELVGPGGEVVGVDTNPLILETARARAQAARLANVSFVAGEIARSVPDGSFDAAVGRCVLFFLADPGAGLRRVVSALRPGGVVAFQEPGNATLRPDALPTCPLLERAWDWILEAYRRAGLDWRMGLRLFPLFVEAGLPAPRMRLDAAVGGGSAWEGYDYIGSTLRAILPLIVSHGVATAEEVGVDSFGARLREEVVGQGSVVTTWSFVTAWARKT